MDDLLSSSLKRKATRLKGNSQRISSNSLRCLLTSMLTNEKSWCVLKSWYTAGGQTVDDFGDGPQIDYEQSLFFLGPSSKTPETHKWPRAWLKARDFSGCRPRFSRLAASQPSRARALSLLTLKKKRDCSQSSPQMDLTRGLVSPIVQARVRLMSSR